jgi:hypothetical protein
LTIVVTDHAVERYLQRVRGVLEARPEIAGRVRRAFEAGRVSDAPRGAIHVHDLDQPDLVYVCVVDRPRDELVVVTLWEEGEDPAVPRRFTDALRQLVRGGRCAAVPAKIQPCAPCKAC